MFYTGKTRENKEILKVQDSSTSRGEKQVLESLHYIKESGYKILEIVESGNITQLGIMFDEHWERKKKMSKNISNPYLDKIYEVAKANGAIGGKVSGAGGGGFLLLVTPPKRQKEVELGLHEMVRINFKIDLRGTQLIYKE